MNQFIQLIASKLMLAIRSRTSIVITLTAAFNALLANGVLHLSSHDIMLVNSVLGVLAILFHVNPSQNYNAPVPQVPPSTPNPQ